VFQQANLQYSYNQRYYTNSVKKILFLRNMSLNIKKILKDFCKTQNPNFYVKLPLSLKKEFEKEYLSRRSKDIEDLATSSGRERSALMDRIISEFAKSNVFAKGIFQKIQEALYRRQSGPHLRGKRDEWTFLQHSIQPRIYDQPGPMSPLITHQLRTKIFPLMEQTFSAWLSIKPPHRQIHDLPTALGKLLNIDLTYELFKTSDQYPLFDQVLRLGSNNEETWLQIFCNVFRISLVVFSLRVDGTLLESSCKIISPNIEIDTTNIPVYYLMETDIHPPYGHGINFYLKAWYPLIPPTGVVVRGTRRSGGGEGVMSNISKWQGQGMINRMYRNGALKKASAHIYKDPGDMTLLESAFGDFFDTTFTPSLEYAEAFCAAWNGDNLPLAKMLGKSRIGQSPGDDGEKEDEKDCLSFTKEVLYDDVDSHFPPRSLLTEKLVKKCCVNSKDPANQEPLVIDEEQRDEGLKYSYLISYVLEHDFLRDGERYINCFNLIYLRQALNTAKKDKKPLQVILTKNREAQGQTFIPIKVTLSAAQIQKAQSQWENLVQTDKENLSKYVEAQYGKKDKAFTNLSSWWYMEQEKSPYVKIVSQSTPYPDFLAVHIISDDDYKKLLDDVKKAAGDKGYDPAVVIKDLEGGIHDSGLPRRYLERKSLYQWIVDASKWTISFPATRILQSYPAMGGFKYVGVNNNILSNGVDYSPYQILQTINEKFEKNLLLKKVEGEWRLDLPWPRAETKNTNATQISQLQKMLEKASGGMKTTLEKRLESLRSSGKTTKNNSLAAFNEICNVSLPEDMRGLDLQTYVDLMCQGINPLGNRNNVIFDYPLWRSLYDNMVNKLQLAETTLLQEELDFNRVNVHEVLAEAEDSEYEGEEHDMVPRSLVRLINESEEEAEAFREVAESNPNINENTNNYCYFILYSILAQAITNIN